MKGCVENIIFLQFFCKGALFRGKGGPPVLEKPARHLPRQGRGFVRPPVKFLQYLKVSLVITLKIWQRISRRHFGTPRGHTEVLLEPWEEPQSARD